MPSPDLLPKGRSLTPAVAPPLEDILNRARFRRARRVGIVAAAAVVGVAGATFAFVPRGASDSLHPVTPAVKQHAASPSVHSVAARIPRLTPPVVQARQRAASQRAAQQAAVAQRQALRAHQSATGQSATPQQSTTQQSSTTHSTPIVGPAHRITRFNPSRSCSGSGPITATGWCSYYSGATSGVAGHAVTLATSVCRLPGQGTGVLQSSNGYQADFDAGRGAYRPVWTWSHGRSFTKAPTSIRVPAGSCVEWYVTWRIVNDAGKPLKPGAYYLDATPQMGSTGAVSGGAYNPRTFVVR